MSNVEARYKGTIFSLANDQNLGIYLVLGVRKSGSSLLNIIVSALAKDCGLNYVDVAGQLFRSGSSVDSWQFDPAISGLLLPGNVLGGFRDYPYGMAAQEKFASAKKILMVRDPRDALVSEYFSNAKTHDIPETGRSRDEMLRLREEASSQSLAEFVLARAELMQRTLLQYVPMISDPMCLILKYEDVILAKKILIDRICAHFDWNVTPEARSTIINLADVVPKVEDPNNFVRRVIPGDHKEKLSERVIDTLNDRLSESLSRFGYCD